MQEQKEQGNPPVAQEAQGQPPLGQGKIIKKGNVQIRITQVLKRWNIKEDEIINDLSYWLVKNVQEFNEYKDYILTYYHETWGSCREWKLVALVNGSYPSGEWRDSSSRKNAHKYKFTRVDELRGKEVEIYVSVSPSCNSHKRYSYRVKVMVE